MSDSLDLTTLGDVASVILFAEASDARAVEYRDAYHELHTMASELLAAHNSNICNLRQMERIHQQLARARSEVKRLRELCRSNGVIPDKVYMERPKRTKIGVE